MGAAIRCDACAQLVSVLDAIRLKVKRPDRQDEEGLHGRAWSKVDICRACWEQPLSWCLNRACDGIALERPDIPSADEVCGILGQPAEEPAP